MLTNDDIMELYREQQRTPLEIIGCCERILKWLLKKGIYNFENISLSQLRSECLGWCEESLKVGDEQYVPVSEMDEPLNDLIEFV